MVQIDPSHFISIHVDSVAGFLSSVILFLFFSFGVYYYLFVRRHKVLIAFAFFQLFMLIYLLGYSLYASSTSLSAVNFWTRICFTGVSLVPLSFYYFVESVIDKRYNRLRLFLVVLSVAFVALVWIDRSMVITDVLNSNISHPTMIKGSLFFVYYSLIVISIIVVHVLFFLKFIRDKHFRESAWPLVIGLVLWTCSSFLDGLLAGILNITRAQIWIGPLAMSFMIIVYLSKNSDRLEQTVRRVLHEKAEVYRQTIRDHLTNVFTRDYLDTVFEKRMETFNPNKESHYLLFIDMDNLKAINDKLGHRLGDMMLQIIGRILQNNCRRSDVAARYGGDEFVMLLFNCTEESAIEIAQRIKDNFTEACSKTLPPNLRKASGISIGISTSKLCKDNLKDMVQFADLAMYYAKRKDKNSIGIYRIESKTNQDYIELL